MGVVVALFLEHSDEQQHVHRVGGRGGGDGRRPDGAVVPRLLRRR